MKIKLDPGAFMPTRNFHKDAGLDLYCPKGQGQIVPAKESAIINTGVHVELPPGTMGEVRSRSGLNIKHGILSEGTVDEGFTGAIVVKLYNHSGWDYEVKEGDRISQLVVTPILRPELELVDELSPSERSDKGFGSSGR